MCCKTLGVDEPGLFKPAGTWCTHCQVGKGCGAYATRPTSCRTYTCVWRQWRETSNDVPDALRPDRCKVVIDAAADGSGHYVRCNADRPDAWRDPAVQKILTGISSVSRLFLVIGDTCREIHSVDPKRAGARPTTHIPR